MQMNSLQPTSYLKEGQGEKIAPLNRMENIAATLFYAINFLSITLTLLFLIESIRNAWFWNEGPPGVVPLLTLMDHHKHCVLPPPEARGLDTPLIWAHIYDWISKESQCVFCNVFALDGLLSFLGCRILPLCAANCFKMGMMSLHVLSWSITQKSTIKMAPSTQLDWI